MRGEEGGRGVGGEMTSVGQEEDEEGGREGGENIRREGVGKRKGLEGERE